MKILINKKDKASIQNAKKKHSLKLFTIKIKEYLGVIFHIIQIDL